MYKMQTCEMACDFEGLAEHDWANHNLTSWQGISNIICTLFLGFLPSNRLTGKRINKQMVNQSNLTQCHLCEFMYTCATPYIIINQKLLILQLIIHQW